MARGLYVRLEVDQHCIQDMRKRAKAHTVHDNSEVGKRRDLRVFSAMLETGHYEQPTVAMIQAAK